MAFWNFASRPATTDPAVVVAPSDLDGQLKDAYERGRRDEHGRRRPRFGLFGLILVVGAALGALFIVVAVRQGSFTAGGAVVDNKLSQAASPVTSTIGNVAAQTGSALQNAGQNLKDEGAALSGQPAESSR